MRRIDNTKPFVSITDEIMELLGTGRQTTPFTRRTKILDAQNAYQVTSALRMRRIQKGENPVGRKIGFTNRTIWDEYGVHQPIWGDIYDTTVSWLSEHKGPFHLKGLAEPRIEPEIVFKLKTKPTAAMDEAALLGCMEWVAHGFELVQSLFPDWDFQVADTIAGCGLHGVLMIGPPHLLHADEQSKWLKDLASFSIDLYRNDTNMDTGFARNVLDGPLSALRHLVSVLENDPYNPDLQAGEIITTGTLTRAFPVQRGEVWRTDLFGLDLPAAEVRFV
jgi:2-oxo-3-hexenedioate decarboxylase